MLAKIELGMTGDALQAGREHGQITTASASTMTWGKAERVSTHCSSAAVSPRMVNTSATVLPSRGLPWKVSSSRGSTELSLDGCRMHQEPNEQRRKLSRRELWRIANHFKLIVTYHH